VNQIVARRNGEYTCLDCQEQCTNVCLRCYNWDKFKLDEEIHRLPYVERSKRNGRKWKNGLRKG
jgi:hypothetical protein